MRRDKTLDQREEVAYGAWMQAVKTFFPEPEKSMKRRRKTQSRGAASNHGTIALLLLLERYNLNMTALAEELGVHKTSACRWLYGSRPSERVARELHRLFPREITLSVLSSWGYRDIA